MTTAPDGESTIKRTLLAAGGSVVTVRLSDVPFLLRPILTYRVGADDCMTGAVSFCSEAAALLHHAGLVRALTTPRRT